VPSGECAREALQTESMDSEASSFELRKRYSTLFKDKRYSAIFGRAAQGFKLGSLEVH